MSQSLANPIDLSRPATRWVQLVLGLVCMMAISSPQYVWTLFTRPLGAALGAAPAAIQVTFSLLIVLQTFFSPFQGWLVDRFGPRRLIAAGGLLTGFSWMLAAHAGSLTMLYLSYGVLGGLGTGIVYVGVVGQMVGWFPDRRGLATGDGGGRLRLRCHRHHLPDRRLHRHRRLPGHAAAIRRAVRRRRVPGRAGTEGAARHDA